MRQLVYFVAEQDKVAALVELNEHYGFDRLLTFRHTQIGVDRLAAHAQAARQERRGAPRRPLAARARPHAGRLQGGQDPVPHRHQRRQSRPGHHRPALRADFDIPEDADTYVHRIGRTGRAGREGTAITFVGEWDLDAWEAIKHRGRRGGRRGPARPLRARLSQSGRPQSARPDDRRPAPPAATDRRSAPRSPASSGCSSRSGPASAIDRVRPSTRSTAVTRGTRRASLRLGAARAGGSDRYAALQDDLGPRRRGPHRTGGAAGAHRPARARGRAAARRPVPGASPPARSVVDESDAVRIGPVVKHPVAGGWPRWRADGFTHYVAKHQNARYAPGEQNEDWLKIPIVLDAGAGFARPADRLARTVAPHQRLRPTAGRARAVLPLRTPRAHHADARSRRPVLTSTPPAAPAPRSMPTGWPRFAASATPTSWSASRPSATPRRSATWCGPPPPAWCSTSPR